MWAVSVDPAAGEKGQQAYSEHLKLKFPLIPDEGRHLSILYGAAQSPNQMSARMAVLIDKKGAVRWINQQLSAKTHAADVIKKMQELGLAKAAG